MSEIHSIVASDDVKVPLQKMFSYELKVRHEPTGQEMKITLNVHDVEGLLLEVKDDLKVVGVPDSELSQFIPPTFLALELLLTPVVVQVQEQPEVVDDQEDFASEGIASLESEGLQEGKVRCSVCQKPISKTNLAKHLKRHTGSMQMCVFPCQHTAKSKQELVAHQCILGNCLMVPNQSASTSIDLTSGIKN